MTSEVAGGGLSQSADAVVRAGERAVRVKAVTARTGGICTSSTRWPWTGTAGIRRRGAVSGSRTRRLHWCARARSGPVRGAALSHQLQLPRRGQPSRGTGRGGGPAGADRAGRHRSRRVLRGGAVLRRRPASWGCPRSSVPSCRWIWRSRRTARPIREGRHLLALAHGPEGYARLARTISRGQLDGGEKGKPAYGDLEEVAAGAAGSRAGADRLPQGECPAGAGRRRASTRRRASWIGWSHCSGVDNVAVELTDHGDPYDDDRNDVLVRARPGRGTARWSPPTTCTTRPRGGAGWPPRSPRCGRGAASTRWTAGCPRPAPRTCAAGPRCSGGSRPTRVRCENAAMFGEDLAFDLQPGRAAAARFPDSGPGTPR